MYFCGSKTNGNEQQLVYGDHMANRCCTAAKRDYWCVRDCTTEGRGSFGNALIGWCLLTMFSLLHKCSLLRSAKLTGSVYVWWRMCEEKLRIFEQFLL